ncbi:hypothetical protein LJB82_03045 [Desulfovibrio sp. OttesenSCG-928-M16]|nr:hypothetical protein [Desulfovibrio sp. OttesenSCG-928-M16]
MRHILSLCVLLLVLCTAACGGDKNVSSLDMEEGGQKASWFGEEQAMLELMRKVSSEYALADPLEAPEKGFSVTYYGQFKIHVELLPLAAPGGEVEDLETVAPSSGIYGIRVTFVRGLDQYENLVDKIYADLVSAFDAKFVRAGAR